MRYRAFLLAVALVMTAAVGGQHFIGTQLAYAQNSCVANENLNETAQSFIGRCCRGGINSEFPGELYSKTLREIKDGSGASYNKAWKLLNDNRFKK
jgi:hypothetical protein